MKIRTCAALLIAAMMLTISGCGFQAAEEQLDAVEEAVEIHVEIAEEAVETHLREVLVPESQPLSQEPATLAAKTVQEPTIPMESSIPVETMPPASSVHTAALTKEEAQAIALKHAGFTEDQVSHLRAEYDMDDRTAEYDVEFREGRWEYEYEIHAETGAILSFEKDD